jgi:hypothetical protein
MFQGFTALLAALIALGGTSTMAAEAEALSKTLSECASGHSLDLAAKQGDSAEQVAETALQLCYQENLEAQNAFRAERMRADPSLPADELVALWDVRRAQLRAVLIDTVNACRATISAGAGRCGLSWIPAGAGSLSEGF